MNEKQLEKLSAALLGAWDADESRAGRAELRQDSPGERETILDFVRALRALPYSLEAQAPPAALKAKILAAAQRPEPSAPAVQLWKAWATGASTEDLVIQRRSEGVWEATGVNGVEVKRLFVDAGRGYVSMLVRMAAGSSYPSHRHGGYEECFVLQGELSVGETVLYAGDYQRAEGGSVHAVQSTEQGCLLFIVSSQHDELLA